MLADARHVDNAVDGAQQMVLRDPGLKAELGEQRRLLNRPLAHHPQRIGPGPLLVGPLTR